MPISSSVNTHSIQENGFRQLEQVEETSRTVVWKAVQTTLDRTVIIRALKPEAATSPDEVAHFLTISRLFARLKCESVAAVFDIVSDKRLHYVVMEHVEGPTLEEVVARQGPLPLDQVLRIASSLAASIAAFWQTAHIVHRNLKSSVIRMDARGVAKITDFSLAIVAGPGVDAAAKDNGLIVGTPCFLSPEQAQGAHLLTTQSDMYALGVILYHLATGHVPFEERDVAGILAGHVRDRIVPPHLRNRSLPVAFSWLLHRLMMKNPNNRYADWADVQRDLGRLLEGAEPSCVRPDEEFLSTIDIDAAAPVPTEDEADTPRVRVSKKTRSRSIAAYQGKHLIDAHADEARRDDRLREALCWTLLACWLALVFWFRALYTPDPNASSLAQLAAPLLDVLREPLPQPEDDPLEPPSSSISPEAPAPSAPSEGAAAAVTPPPPEKPAADLLPEMPAALRDMLVTAFAAGDLPSARAAVRSMASDFRARGELQALLDRTPTPDELLAEQIRTQIGRPVMIEHNGKPRTVIPRSVTQDTVQLETNGRGVDVPFTALPSDTRLRWLGAPPRDPDRLLAYCLTLLRSSRRDELPALAAGLPSPFADLLSRAAEQQTPPASPPAE